MSESVETLVKQILAELSDSGSASQEQSIVLSVLMRRQRLIILFLKNTQTG